MRTKLQTPPSQVGLRRHIDRVAIAMLAGSFLAAYAEEPPGVEGEPVGDCPTPQETRVRMDPIRYGATPMTTRTDWEVKNFQIPAPRSEIVSSDGVLLAVNRVARRLVLRLAEVAESPEAAWEKVRDLPPKFVEGVPLHSLNEAEVVKHFTHRPWIPLAVSGMIPDEIVPSLEEGLPKGFSLEPLYRREYPEGELMAHIVGYVGVSLPDQRGPVARVEYAWPPTVGRSGIEMTLDETLHGSDGEVLRLYDLEGNLQHQELVREARQGETLVLSINMAMQRLAVEQLAASKRPGAFVAIDADTGDILAMASYPSFDPNLFVGGISRETLDSLSEGKDAPLFDRAVTGAYPPGSTFKAFVALAGMEAGAIDGTRTLLEGPSGLIVGGRVFKNWNTEPEGLMDVRFALVRSCNTWFYQAALNTGAGPITSVSHRFGLGIAPDLPLPSVSSGNIPDPETYSDPRSVANYAIGQGRVLTSPVQMAFAMAGLANGSFVPRPRLVNARLDPESGAVVKTVDRGIAHFLALDETMIDIVRDGLWGVVNHPEGTAGGASMRKPVVYGKTGTSQWSAGGGEMRSLAWFTGWVDAERPRIAFAAVTQAKGRETLSGGRSAAPIAAGVLRKAYADPETFAVTVPDVPSRPYPALVAALPVEELIELDFDRRPTLGGFLRFIFGGRR